MGRCPCVWRHVWRECGSRQTLDALGQSLPRAAWLLCPALGQKPDQPLPAATGPTLLAADGGHSAGRTPPGCGTDGTARADNDDCAGRHWRMSHCLHFSARIRTMQKGACGLGRDRGAGRRELLFPMLAAVARRRRCAGQGGTQELFEWQQNRFDTAPARVSSAAPPWGIASLAVRPSWCCWRPVGAACWPRNRRRSRRRHRAVYGPSLSRKPL